MKLQPLYSAATLVALVAMASPAWAQSGRQNQSQQQNRMQQQQNRMRQNQPQRMQQNQPQSGQQQVRLQLDPEGWVRIAADYDGDGRFDAVETIFAFDLQRAQQMSRQRRQGQRNTQSQYGASYRGQDDRQMQRRDVRQMARHPLSRIQGQVRDLTTVQLFGNQDQEVLARVQTQQGRTAKVALGPRQKIQQLRLQEGDQITVLGKPGRINERAMLIAYRVEAGGNSLNVNRQFQDRGLRPFRGELLGTRTTKLRNMDQQQVIARVRLDQGQTVQAILGPQSKVQNLNLQQGDQITVLGHIARLNQQPALVAEQVAANQNVVTVDLHKQERYRRQQQGQQGQQQRDRQQRNQQRGG